MNHKLREWQDRYTAAQTAYNDEIAKMDGRERLYKGDGEIKKIIVGDRTTKTPLVRNICSELVEAQVNSNIPQPKVTAIREKDELKAKLIEDMLRNELDRLPMEYINEAHNGVTQACLDYLAPLIVGELPIVYKNGMPAHFSFD